MARQPQPTGRAERGWTGFAGLGQHDGCAALGRQFVGLRLRDGLAGVAVLGEQRLRRRLASTPVTPTLASRSDEDRAVQAAVVPAVHSDSPWSADRCGASANSGKSRW